MEAKEVNASTAQEIAAKYLGCSHDTTNVIVSEFIREAVAEKIDREREVHITVGPTASNLPVPSWMAPHGEIIKKYRCKYCGAPSEVDPADQLPPPDYCYEADHVSF